MSARVAVMSRKPPPGSSSIPKSRYGPSMAATSWCNAGSSGIAVATKLATVRTVASRLALSESENLRFERPRRRSEDRRLTETSPSRARATEDVQKDSPAASSKSRTMTGV